VLGVENVQALLSGDNQQIIASETTTSFQKIHSEALGAYNNFERHGRLEQLEQAIVGFQSAINMIAEDDPRLPTALSNLGICLLDRFECLGNVADINESIAVKERAVTLTLEGDLDKASRLNNLGNSLQARFRRFGNLADIEGALKSQQAVIDLTPDGDPNQPGRLNNLGSFLHTRFQRLGELADLDNGIMSQQAAVNLTPDGHPDKPSYLNNLGNSLESRFRRLENLEDLDNAIILQQAAVNLTPNDRPDKSMYLTNLGNSLKTRFERLGNVEDLNNAIESQRAAVGLTSDGHPYKLGYLNNLGCSLDARFKRLGLLEDLNNAIVSQRAAADLTPHGHPDKPGRLSNLGISLMTRFHRLRKFEDLIGSITTIETALDLAPDDHLIKLTCLNALGEAFWTRFDFFHRPDDAEAAISNLSIAATLRYGTPIHRFNAAKGWAYLASVTAHSSLLKAYECAITMIPLVAWLGLPIANRHHHLAEIGWITRDAAAAAISLGEYDRALGWLEQGRSIVWTQILRLRTPVDDLKDIQPDLAEHLVQVSRLLDQGARQGGILDGGAHETHEQGRQYRALTAEWESLIEQVRSLPNFEDFLKPPNSVQLLRAAQDGPVVVLNAAKERCDALALVPGSDDVVHIPLPNITSERIKELAEELKGSLCSSGVRVRGERAAKKVEDETISNCVKETLAELWNDLVKPVLDSLAFSVCLT
jgi:tetratricopeptide (TPR) repeat protein